MELDVEIIRSGDEQWGFELSGDSKLPIKINKVLECSPAEEAGLREGDVMTRIQNVDTTGLTLDAVMTVVDDNSEKLTLTVTRGLYDPVIDDQEPIYETYEPADFDPQSQPTEVQFKIQQFTQTPTLDANISPTLIKPSPSTSSPLLQPEPIREPRPLTPFDESKRYRPFSTEPLPEVPPLEEPIILNPNYKDPFCINSDKEDAKELGFVPIEKKFKLPVSDQYDPEGNKKKIDHKIDNNNIIERKMIEVTEDMLNYIKTVEEKKKKQILIKKEINNQCEIEKQTNITVKKTQESNSLKIDEQKKKEALKFMKQEIDLSRIEETALNIVKENIKRAVSVTEEIKKEVDITLSASVTPDAELQDIHKESAEVIEIKKDRTNYKELEIVESTEKISIDTPKITVTKSNEDCKVIENGVQQNVFKQKETESLKEDFVVEKQNSQEKKETIINSDKQEKQSHPKIDNTKVIEDKFKKSEEFDEKYYESEKIPHQNKTKAISAEQSAVCKIVSNENLKNSNDFPNETAATKKTQQKQYSQTMKKELNKSEYKKQQTIPSNEISRRLEPENRVFTIGLQTIPNLCGVVQSKHLDLLLKTFFIHLTDVMVALSRLILTKPSSISSESNDNTYRNDEIKDSVQVKKYEKSLKQDDIREYKINNKMNDIKEENRKQTTEENIGQISLVKKDEQANGIITENTQTLQETKLSNIFVEEVRDRDLKQENTREEHFSKIEENKNIMEKKKLGAEMYQMCERKPEELTQKMDAVISEFESKTAVEEMQIKQCARRYRSRSQIEKEVMRESDPLEWLAKVDSRTSQEREISTKREYFNKMESETKLFETRNESRKFSYTKPIPAKQMYVAIVESHVFTNKNAIFKDLAAEKAETTSVQNFQSVNTAYQNKSVFSESQSVLSSNVKENSAKIVELRQLPVINAKNEKSVEIFEEIDNNISNFSKPNTQTALATRQSKQVLVQEMQQVIEPVEKIDKNIAIVKKIDSQTVKNHRSIATVESTALTDLIEAKQFEVKDFKTEHGNVSSESSHKALFVTEVEPEMSYLLNTNVEKITPVKPSIAMESKLAVQILEIDSVNDELTELEISIEHPKTLRSIGITENVAYQIVETQPNRDTSDMKIPEKYTETAKVQTVKHINNAILVNKIDSLKDEMTDLELPDQKLKVIDSIGIVEHSAITVNEVNANNDELLDLNIAKVTEKISKIDLTENKKIAIEISDVEIIDDDVNDLNVVEEKTMTVEKVDYVPHVGVQVCETEATKDELAELSISKEQTIKPNTNVADPKLIAIQITEIESLKYELDDLETKKEKPFNVDSIEYIEQAAINIIEVEVSKDDLSELNVPIVPTNIPKVDLVEEKHTAIEINEIESIKDNLTEFVVNKEKLQTVQSIGIVEKVALKVSEVEVAYDELYDIDVPMKKNKAAKLGLVEGRYTAVQINEINTLTHDFSELNITKNASNVTASVGVIEQSAVNVTIVDASKVEFSELKVPKENREVAQVKVIEKESKAVQIKEIEPVKCGITELAVAKPQLADITLTLTKERVHAIEISEVETKKDEFSEFSINKHKLIDIALSLELGERYTGVQITEIEAITDDMSELDILKQKSIDITKSMIEMAPALQISEVEARNDEFTEFHIAKKQIAGISASITAKKCNALQVTEVETVQNELDELNIKKQQLIDITPSVEVDHKFSAVQITEVVIHKDETKDINISKHKTIDVSKSIAETTSALQISEVETRTDEIAELCVTKQQTADVSASITAKKSNSVQITKVETIQNEFAELNIKQHQIIDITPSVEKERTSAVEITEIDSTQDEIAELNLSKESTMHITESILETPSAIEITEVQAIRDEYAELNVSKQQTEEVSASITAKKSNVLKIKEVTAQEEFSELNIKKQASIDVDTSPEIIEITEIDEDEDSSSHKVIQNGFARSAHVIKQQDNSLRMSKYRSEHNTTGREIKKVKLQSELNIESNKTNKNSNKTMISKSKHEAENSVELSQTKAENLASQHMEDFNQFNSRKSQSFSKNTKYLTLQTDLSAHSVTTEHEIISLSPPILPPTPLIDEYIFRLEAPLPKSRGTTPIPPEYFQAPIKREDPHIIKKKLIPYIELTIERIIYDPPLPTPPEGQPLPVYTKPGLRGGCGYLYFYKDEIREIEKKSSLLTSAIDETIKSIEEYKHEVGIDKIEEIKKDTLKSEVKTIEKHKIVQNGNISPENLLIEPNVNEIIQNGHITIEKINKQEIKVSNNTELEVQIEETDNNINGSSKTISHIEQNVSNLETREKSQSIETEFYPKSNLKEEITPKEVESKPLEDELKVTQDLENKRKTNEKISNDFQIVDRKTNKESNITEKKVDITQNEIKDTKHINSTEEIENITVSGTRAFESNKIITESDDRTSVNDKKIPESEKKPLERDVSTLEPVRDKHTPETDGKPPESDLKASVSEEKISQNDLKTNISDEITLKGKKKEEEKIDYLQYVKPVKFDPEAMKSSRNTPIPMIQGEKLNQIQRPKPYVSEDGEVLGTIKDIVDGLEEPVLDEEVAKGFGKPGLPEDTIAEIISGEADILREAHVMGLSGVLSSHMHRPEEEGDPTIKSLVNTLKDSAVLKALNEEIVQKKLEEEKKWTTFLQKPRRPVPKTRYSYHRSIEEEGGLEKPYRVVIVKQPKPKIAPDFKPEDFDTGPLPWEEKVEEEASLPLVPQQEPILVPEAPPEFIKAIDSLPENEIPDLEDTGIKLPLNKTVKEPIQIQEVPIRVLEKSTVGCLPEDISSLLVSKETPETMVVEDNRITEDLITSIQNIVDPNASLEQQLAQMRAQLSALAKLRSVIQQTLELVSKQLVGLSYQGIQQSNVNSEDNKNNANQKNGDIKVQNEFDNYEETMEEKRHGIQTEDNYKVNVVKKDRKEQSSQDQIEEIIEMSKEELLEEQRKNEKQRKEQLQRKSESRQIKHRSTPRVGKPKPVFGPLNPEDRPLILPGGRKWRCPQDIDEDQLMAMMMEENAEVIKGNAIGINFMKYEKPPVSLDHLKNSEVFKFVHDMDEKPLKKVELLGPVIAEADYRKKCRSRTPNPIETFNGRQPQFQP